MISGLLTDCRQRIKELYGLTLEKIEEALDAGEIDKVDGVEYIDRPDHQTRLLAVNEFTKLLRGRVETKVKGLLAGMTESGKPATGITWQPDRGGRNHSRMEELVTND